MQDNPQPLPDNGSAAAAALAALPGHRVIALAGRDAETFAHAQFMNDVVALPVGHWQWNGWLTAKGRVIALFALLKLDAETLWLLVPDADAFALAEQLRRFLFRRKAAIGVREDLGAIAGFAPPAAAHGSQWAGDPATGIELDMGGAAPRVLKIAPMPPARPVDPAFVERWAAADLRHGLPRLPASQAEHWTPQQLSLERLRAFSVKKGCYPGQEIVARTHFLGQAKRGLALFKSDAPLVPGHEVREDGNVFGTVLATAEDDGHHLALAVAPLDRFAEAPVSDGIPLRALPLLEGLAR
ncbi:MAG TPA: folate-binding protein [Lysobacter sp.]|nr:folate-binding protein [Lysobacter sp.]